MRLSPKSLIVDLLSTVGERSIPVRALIAAGGVFGMRGETMRVALVRLREAGTIERNQRGQYRISPTARAVQQHVVNWDRIDERLVAWQGSWIGVCAGAEGRADRSRLRRRLRALQLMGLRQLAAGLWIRPDNLRGGVDSARRELVALGLEATSPVFQIQQLDAHSEARARQLWDAPQMRRSYREQCRLLQRSAQRLAGLCASEAMAESFLVGGKAIRLLVLDPLLPEPIVPAAERRALLEALRNYDRLGREQWRPFMKSHGAPHLRAPLTAPSLRSAAYATAAVQGL